MSVTEAANILNRDNAAAKAKWKRNVEAVNKARLANKMQPMDSWTETVLSTVLETYNNRVNMINARNSMGMGRVVEATQTGDVSFLRTHGINILTATMPSLIANELVSVQPLQARVGELRYLDVKFGDTKGRIKAGETMFSNERVGGPSAEFNYSADEINGETLVFDSAKKAANLSWFPVVPGSVKFKLDGADFTDNKSGKILKAGADAGTINYATGAIVLTAAATNVNDVFADYQYNNVDAPTEAPELDLSVKGIPVIARARKLKTVMSFDAMFDLQAQYGFDASTEQATLASQYLQYEIDGEMISDMYASAGATQTSFNATVPNAVSMLDHYEGFIKILNEASNNIFEASRFGNGTWAVLGLDAATIVESLANRGFIASGQTGNGPHFIGKMGNFSMYKTPQMGANGVADRTGYVVGYKGESMFHAGMIYAPYCPIMTTDLLAQEDFGIRQGYATSYAKKMVNAMLFSKGKITH